MVTEPLAPPEPRGAFSLTVSGLYDRVLSVVPRGSRPDVEVDVNPDAPSFDWQPNLGPDRREELRLALEGGVTPYIRRTADGRLLVSVAEPARRGNQSVGIVLLTREAREVDQRLFEIRASVLGIFGVALVLTVALSFYLAQTLANPIMQLAGSAAAMRQGEGRSGSVPPALLAREDEIGILARDLQSAARALWARIDTNERFAADVAHELRNPLTSVRSAIETLRRIENPEQRNRLLAIIAEDAVRMDRLIADISDSSRVDAELSRTVAVAVDIAPILSTLVSCIRRRGRRTTRAWCSRRRPPGWWCAASKAGWCRCCATCWATRCPSARPSGRVFARARPAGAMVEVGVEDEGPGIPRPSSRASSGGSIPSGRGRAVRAAFRARPVDLPADRRGPARPHRRREPPGCGGEGDRRGSS